MPQNKVIRVAVVDVGTLKSKFEVREFDKDFNHKVLHSDKELTVLGRDLDKTDNQIIDTAIQKTVSALNKFKAKMAELGVDRYCVVGTEAIRKATNADAVIKQIETETGIQLKILSHQDEAEIYFRSVSKDFPNQTIAVSDIGGGSVQVVIGRNNKIYKSYLFKTGTYFMQEVFSKTHHPTQKELQNAIDYVAKELHLLSKDNNKPELLIYGSTNIVDFFQAMQLKLTPLKSGGDHKFKIKKSNLKPLYKKIISLSYEDRMPMYPAEPYYMWAADKALMNIFQICDYLKINTIVPSNNNISSGLLYQLVTKDGTIQAS